MKTLKIYFQEIQKEDKTIKKIKNTIDSLLGMEEASKPGEANLIISQGVKFLKTEYSRQKKYLILKTAWDKEFRDKKKPENIFLYTPENALSDFWITFNLIKEEKRAQEGNY